MKKYFSMLYLLAANLATVFVGLASIPVLASVYGPQQFGEWAIVLSLASLLTIFTTLQLEQFITAVRRRYQAHLLLAAGAAFAVLACVACMVVGAVAAMVMGQMHWLFMAAIVSVLALLLSINQLLQQLFTRERFYKILANRALFFALARFGVQFFTGLVSGEIITRLLHPAIAPYGYMRRTLAVCRTLWRRAGLLWGYVARRWLKKALHLVAARIVSDANYLMLPLIIGFMYDISAVGQFNIAHNAVLSAINAVLVTFGSVYIGESALYYHTDRTRFRRYYFGMIFLMAAVGIGMYVFSLYYAKTVIDMVFHKKWANVYDYFMLLLPAFSVQMATGATAGVLNIIGKPQYYLYINLLWNAVFWPFAAYCMLSGASIEYFIWGFGLTVIVRCLANFVVTTYWLAR